MADTVNLKLILMNLSCHRLYILPSTFLNTYVKRLFRVESQALKN